MLFSSSVYRAALSALVLLQAKSSCSLPVNNKDDAWRFLEQFGYLDSKLGEINDQDGTVFVKYLKDMQYMGGLNQTGLLDDATMALMNTPRCSITDRSMGSSVRRRRRYALEGSKWRTFPLTFGITKFTSQMPQEQQKGIVRNALNFWSQVSSLTFSEVVTNPTINISFVRRDHGDGYPFDGRGGVLAHAFYPQYGGHAHFDDDEQWTDGVNSGTNLLQVAIHEFGHSLGLAHSNVLGSIMYPYYTGYTENPKLTDDDISGIQILYGPKTTTTPSTTSTTRTTTRSTSSTTRTTRNPGFPDGNPTVTTPTTSRTTATPTTPTSTTTTRPRLAICDNPVVDAIVYAEDKTYAFSGNYVYSLDGFGVEAGYPKLISSKWPQVYGKVDAALYYPPQTTTDSQGRTTVVKQGSFYLFQGTKFYKYSNINQLDSGYPRDIRNGFPGIPDNVDASFHWGGNGRVFFFKDSNYYRYTQTIGTDAGYPRPISIWTGVPNSISAAFTWKNGRTYFFKGTQYYRFDDYNFRVDSGYPRNIGIGWFGCSISGNLQSENEYDRNPFREVDDSSSSRLTVKSYLHLFIILASVFLQSFINRHI